MRTILLAGRDHTETGAIEVQAGERVAVAISRGGAPKLYDYTDPNEDATLCAEGPGGLLTAVADGHWGHDGARAALECIADIAGRAPGAASAPGAAGAATRADPPVAPVGGWLDSETREAEVWRRELVAAVRAAHDAVLRTHMGERRPRTTLSLALVRPREGWIFAAAVGDSHVFRVDAEGAVELGWPRRSPARFLGHRKVDSTWVERATRIATSAAGGAWGVAAATDGLSEAGIGCEEPDRAVHRAFAKARAGGEGARGAARGVAEAANAEQRANGAGDNVGVSIAYLPSEA